MYMLHLSPALASKTWLLLESWIYLVLGIKGTVNVIYSNYVSNLLLLRQLGFGDKGIEKKHNSISSLQLMDLVRYVLGFLEVISMVTRRIRI